MAGTDCRPSVRGEIKKARAGNYESCSCVFEFIDNALDARADRIRILLREKSGSGFPHKLLISDNHPGGIPPEILARIFCWTFERKRGENDVGEYGTGFKNAAVNLAEKLTVFTLAGNQAYQALADWQDMAEEDRWTPKIMEVSSDYFYDIHPFSKGSTFLLEGLRNEMFPLITPSNEERSMTVASMFFQKLVDEIAYHYRYLLLEMPTIQIFLKGIGPAGPEICEMNIRDHDFFKDQMVPFWKPTDREETEDTLSVPIVVYQDTVQFYRIYFQLGKKWETVEFVNKRKNGNSVLKCHEVSPTIFEGMRKIDILQFRSVHLRDPMHSSQCMDLYPTCTLDLIRRGRVMGKNLSVRAHRAEPLQWFVKHELWYQSYYLNPLLGVQFNKQNHGTLRENQLKYTLEYLQQLHQREFYKIEKVVQTALPEVVTPIKPDPGSEVGTATLVPIPLPFTPPPALTDPLIKRKHFTPNTKIQVLNRQECRDSVLDFVLKDPLLLMEYDHKNGNPTENHSDNCQALSVVTHSIKTRCPGMWEELVSCPEKKTRFIVELLNCITRSKFFFEAWISGEVQVRSLQQQVGVIQEGLFFCTP